MKFVFQIQIMLKADWLNIGAKTKEKMHCTWSCTRIRSKSLLQTWTCKKTRLAQPDTRLVEHTAINILSVSTVHVECCDVVHFTPVSAGLYYICILLFFHSSLFLPVLKHSCHIQTGWSLYRLKAPFSRWFCIDFRWT